MNAAQERTTADDQSRFVVTLVHGTFAKNAAWTRPDSTLCTALRARFGQRVLIDTMRWSGRNTFSARHKGAAALRDAVLKNRPDLPHIVIGHSHAGNIAIYAAMDRETNQRIGGIVTLATPFIVARRRNLGQTGKVAALTFAGLCYLAAIELARLVWPLDWADTGMSWINVLLLPLVAALAIQLPVIRLLKRWSASCERMLEELQQGGIDRGRFLIIRAVADEATGGITFMQFPSLAMTLILGGVARFADGSLRWYSRLMRRPFVGALFVVGTFVLAFLLALAVSFVTSGLIGQIVFFTLMVLA